MNTKLELFLVLLVLIPLKISASSVQVTLPVAGSLNSEIGASIEQITELTISGPINGTDIVYIRSMSKLVRLNLQDAMIVEGGDFILQEGNYTENNILPDSAFWQALLKELLLPKDIIAIGKSAFKNCINLENIVVPSSVSIVEEEAFLGCNSLQEVVLSDNITKIGNRAFQDCVSLQKITLPKNLMSPSDFLFENCENLEDVLIPEGWTEIGIGMFMGCTSLTTVNLSNSIETIHEGAFYLCPNLTEIHLSEQVDSIGKNAFASSGITKFTFPEKTTIVSSTCFQYSQIEEVELNANCTFIDWKAFSRCFKLNKIDFNSTTPPEVSEDVFEDITDLSKIILYVPFGIKHVYESHSFWKDFTIVEKAPNSSIVTPSDSFHVTTYPGGLSILSEKISDIQIYTLNGKLVKQTKSTIGLINIVLNKGVYIIKIDNTSIKINL